MPKNKFQSVQCIFWNLVLAVIWNFQNKKPSRNLISRGLVFYRKGIVYKSVLSTCGDKLV